MGARFVRLSKGSPLIVLVVIYFVVMTGVILAEGDRPTWDQAAVLALAALVLASQGVPFVRDWGPFLMLLLGYEYLRGLVPSLGAEVNVLPLIEADQALFGRLPVVALQSALYEPGHPGPLAYVSTFFYLSHAAIPVLFALYLWIVDRRLFHTFTVALVVLSFAAFATYVAYPAMPPWMAGEQGYIPVVHKVVDECLARFSGGDGFVTFNGLVRSNPVAAMPSLHAAYPLLVVLFAWLRWRWWALVALPYPLMVWFSIVFTGHHYVIDALVGAAYAVVVFVGVVLWRHLAEHQGGVQEGPRARTTDPPASAARCAALRGHRVGVGLG